MRIPTAILVVLASVLAGCSGDDHTALAGVDCPGGLTLDPETVEGHHAKGFDPAAHCPALPSVTLTLAASNVTRYGDVAYTWVLDNGSLGKAHSMLTTIRWSEKPVPDDQLAGKDSYGTELLKREHQDLPVTYRGNVSFTKASTVYLRAYAEIERVDYWSPEVALTVEAVPPTGVTRTFVHEAGDFVGGYTATTIDADLGDSVAFQNDDVRPHTFTASEVPAGVDFPDTTVPAGESSDPFALSEPGTYRFTTDDAQPVTLELRVRTP